MRQQLREGMGFTIVNLILIHARDGYLPNTEEIGIALRSLNEDELDYVRSRVLATKKD